MSNKNFPARFCIYFNEKDCRHLKAAKILETKGRKKAQFITDTILYYEKEYSNKALPEQKETIHTQISVACEATNIEKISKNSTNAILKNLNHFKKQ